MSREQARQALERARRVAVATHITPDADAISSLIGLTQILRRLGKEAKPFCDDELPPRLRAIPHAEEISRAARAPSIFWSAWTPATPPAWARPSRRSGRLPC
jgi:Exopolyphosphatase-related proteins